MNIYNLVYRLCEKFVIDSMLQLSMIILVCDVEGG